jgi:NAD+ kinase
MTLGSNAVGRRTAIRGRNLDDLRELLLPYDVELVEEDPDIVISHGGDGALLGAEREFPGIPKYPLRDRRNNPACPRHDGRRVLDMAFSGQLRRFEVVKLEGFLDGCRIAALNDIAIHRVELSSAVRYRLMLNGEIHANHIVGDGLIASTPFGSTGYYRSITHSLFRIGLGLAFNNTTEPIDHLVVEEECRIEVEILRGPAVLVADNDPKQFDLRTGDVVEFAKAETCAVIYGLDILRCRDCFLLRQKMDNPN